MPAKVRGIRSANCVESFKIKCLVLKVPLPCAPAWSRAVIRLSKDTSPFPLSHH